MKLGVVRWLEFSRRTPSSERSPTPGRCLENATVKRGERRLAGKTEIQGQFDLPDGIEKKYQTRRDGSLRRAEESAAGEYEMFFLVNASYKYFL